MEFGLNEIQEEFKSTAHKFFKETCSISELRKVETLNNGFSPALYKEIAELGFLGLIIPEEYGGVGGSLMDLAIVVEEAGWAALPAPFLSTISYGVIPLLENGTEEQKRMLLPQIAEGKLIFTGAMSEPKAHYDLRHVAALADADGDGYSLSGKKLFVPFGESADYLLTLARTSSGQSVGEQGLSLFLVKGSQPGIHFKPLPAVGPDRLYEVEYQNVTLLSSDALGDINNGWSVTQKTIQMAAALQCVEMAGVLRRALEVTNDYVKERRQFGRPIGSYQSVQHRLSDMFTIVEGGRLAAYQAIWRLEAGLPAEREVSIAKVWLGKAGQNVLTGAHQLHGGMGIDLDYPLQFCYRRFKSQQLNLGNASAFLKQISQSLGKQSNPAIDSIAVRS
ncbi:acyl-CoA dehydrogenase family protein [Neobacillus citreus]|uniref:Acyl-CoA/acyl-ACP dehydrogenase n=1 Tax=Neobacillus citreus TaxID=2833578 RepID=A0A942YBR8_9BACI|nr:acyl-CoA dehydrogenase family protein [Neobacillus citreus]MCH6267278.1 acyl-CoA/acyl-ACP dehydrogenase [Neobacillus citreus]